MSDQNARPLVQRIFYGSLLLLGSVIAIWLGLQLLSQIWAWIMLLLAIGAVVGGAIWFIRWRRDRRW